MKRRYTGNKHSVQHTHTQAHTRDTASHANGTVTIAVCKHNLTDISEADDIDEGMREVKVAITGGLSPVHLAANFLTSAR